MMNYRPSGINWGVQGGAERGGSGGQLPPPWNFGLFKYCNLKFLGDFSKYLSSIFLKQLTIFY